MASEGDAAKQFSASDITNVEGAFWHVVPDWTPYALRALDWIVNWIVYCNIICEGYII